MSDFVALKIDLRNPFLWAISSPSILICLSAQKMSDFDMNSLNIEEICTNWQLETDKNIPQHKINRLSDCF